jgi:hypothetical protein
MLFPGKAQMRGEEICNIVSIAWKAALVSRPFLVDSSEISALLIGKRRESPMGINARDVI